MSEMMKQDILVTVIIPVYNTEKYIQECMQSVLQQTYQNLQILLINDGSTDNSAEICRRYEADPRVCFIDRENRGLSATRQEGIDLAKGEYFCNLDSDDCMELSFVEKMLSKILAADADMATCGRLDFDQGYTQALYLPHGPEQIELTRQRISWDFEALNKQLWLADSWNKMYKTAFVRQSGVQYFLPNRFNGTDLSFNHLLALHLPKVVVVNEPLLLHRIVAGSRVHRKNKPLQEGFETITDRVFAEAETLGYDDAFKTGYCAVYAKFLDMVFEAIITESERFSELKERLNAFYRRRNAYEKKHPELTVKKMIARGTTLKARLFYSCIYGKQKGLCYLLFFRKQLKSWQSRG